MTLNFIYVLQQNYCTNFFPVLEIFGDFDLEISLSFGHCQNVLRCRKKSFFVKRSFSERFITVSSLFGVFGIVVGFECFISLLME